MRFTPAPNSRLARFNSILAVSPATGVSIPSSKNILWRFLMTKLPIDELKTALKRLPDWNLAEKREAITRKFQFVDFDAAFAFMTRTALKAAEMDHHPEWFNVYNKVEVTLATHDAGGVTQKDIELATAMDGYAALMSGGRT